MRNPKDQPEARTVKPALPTNFAARRFACRCFGVNLPEMQRMLEIMRSREDEPDKHFPKTLNRVMLNEAEAGKGKWCGILITVADEALYNRIRRINSQPLIGCAGHVTERLVFGLLSLYEAISPRLNLDRIPCDEVLEVIINEVFVPTVFLKLALNRDRAERTEFDIETCWYLPVVKDGQQWGPVRTILQHWLWSVGFRNAHDLKKELNSDSSRRSADRWLSGDIVPTIDELHRLVDKFHKPVQLAGDKGDWKTRFTLACGLAHLYAAMDELRPKSSMAARRLLRDVQKDGVAVDDDGVLTDSLTFFATRLIQRRLQREGAWDEIVQSRVQATLAKQYPANPSDEEIETFRSAMEWGMNPGNWLLHFIETEAIRLIGPGTAPHSSMIGWSLSKRILELGIRELNQVLDAKRGRRESPRQP